MRTVMGKFRAIGVVVLLGLVVEAGSLFYVAESISKQAHELASEEIPLLDHAHRLRFAVVQVQQWLTDISATRGQDGLNDGFDKAAEYASMVTQELATLQEIHPESKELFAEFEPAFNAYYAVGQEMARSYVAEGPAGGNQKMAKFDSAAEKMTQKVDEVMALAQKHSKESLALQLDTIDKARFAIIGFSLLLAATMAGVFIVIRGTISPIPRINVTLGEIAQGHLSANATLASNRSDEIGQLVASVDKMRSGLLSIVARIADSSGQLSAAVNELDGLSDQNTKMASEQQDEVNQIVTAITELSNSAMEITRNAGEATEVAHNANQDAKEGRSVTSHAVEAVRHVATITENAAQVIFNLKGHVEEINDILNAVSTIAEQTNLLALNASIEAARAGEHGRGFAIVADEVRTLAGKTRESTENIRNIIEQLESSAASAVEVMEQGRKQATESSELVEEAGHKLEDIARNVEQIYSINGAIEKACRQQSEACVEINRNIIKAQNHIDDTLDGSTKIADTTKQVSQLAAALRRTEKQFIID